MWRTFGSMDFKWLQNSKNEVLSLNTTHPSCHTILRGPRIFKSDQVRAPQLYLPEWDRNPSQHWRESPAEHSKASPWMKSIQQGVPAMWEKMVKPKARKIRKYSQIPSGKRLHNYGKSPFWMGKATISMAIFNNYVTNYQRVYHISHDHPIIHHC